MTADVVVGAYHDWSFFVKGSYTYSAAAMFDRLCLQGNQPPRAELLASVRNSQRQIHRAVPFVEQEHIESVANACLEKIGYFDGPVDLFEICRWQRDECGLSVKYEPSRPGNPVLGTMSGAPIEICLYSNSPESGRSRFTLAHELGHLLMRHNLYMSSERTYESAALCREALPETLARMSGLLQDRRVEAPPLHSVSCPALTDRLAPRSATGSSHGSTTVW